MKCPKCKGNGTYLEDNLHCICEACHGSGEVQMTNEEYLKSCNTEELAEELNRISMNETSVENWLWWLQGVRNDNNV